jgi:TetR/AcrR family transcriptional regulator, mexJK operon transcriptional repressor
MPAIKAARIGHHAPAGAEAELATRRGRPTRARAANLRRTMVDAASSLFLRDGYGATSMEQIASEARVSKGTLYARFPDKASLFVAVVAERRESWVASAPWRVSTKTTLRELLLDLANNSLDQLESSEMGRFVNLIMAEASRFPEVARGFYEVAFEAAVKSVAIALIKALGPEQPLVRNPERMISALFTILWGWSNLRLLRGLDSDEATRRNVAEQFVDIIIDGARAW